MARFCRGFVYEVGVTAPLTVEGRRVEVPEGGDPEAAARAWIERYAAERQAAAQRCLTELKARRKDSWNEYRLDNPGFSPMLADLLADLSVGPAAAAILESGPAHQRPTQMGDRARP